MVTAIRGALARDDESSAHRGRILAAASLTACVRRTGSFRCERHPPSARWCRPSRQILEAACADCFGSAPKLVDARAKLPIRLEVDEPFTVGADRIANTLAASRIWKRDAIVVDLGTATTYDCITADGAFIGGVIQPGVRTSAETLFRRTSQLSATELIPPKQ